MRWAKKTKKKPKSDRKKAEYSEKKAALANKKALWKTYHDLHRKAEELMVKIRSDLKRGSVEDTRRDANELLLLMGECSYMAQECKKMQAKRK